MNKSSHPAIVRSICLCLAALLPGVGGLQAQGIFNQNGSQAKLQIQQIAALKVYAGYLEQGYKVVRDGTKLIGDAKNGELNLHKDYFGSLATVNPEIRNSEKARAIPEMRDALRQLDGKTLQTAAGSLFFSPEEMAMLRHILNSLEQEAEKGIKELELIIRDGMIEVSDGQRLQQLDRLYEKMSAFYGTALQWHRITNQLGQSRQRTDKDLEVFRELYGIKK